MSPASKGDNGSGELRLRFGAAGLGVGTAAVFPGVERFAQADIVAAADVRNSALKAFESKYGGRTYRSVEELCEDPNVDVIWVGTPNHLHAAHAIMAAEHGKHVICTKPMALTVEECEAMCEAAEANHVELVCGHTASMSANIQAMKAVVGSGELGRLIAINCWMYSDWLLKPRIAEELDETRGGGVIFRHGPHLIDTIRLLGGGRIRSVRAMVGRWMPERSCPGNVSAYMEFEDGTPATIVYSGYGYFDTSELTWGIGNRMYSPEERVEVRRRIRAGEVDDEAAKEGMRFGASTSEASSTSRAATASGSQSGWFGLTLASFERGDCRLSPNGLYVYGDSGTREIPVTGGLGVGTLEMSELYGALTAGIPVQHSGRWGLATLEVANAFVQSAVERKEIFLSHQCAMAEV